MTRFYITLPDIDYGNDSTVQFPVISNRLDDFVISNDKSLAIKFHRWGTQSDNPFHCFVDDWRLESIWRHKYKMVDRVLMSRFACLPDYTVETNTPLAYAFYQVWRSRTVGRFWQDHGVFCIPTLQWSRVTINTFLFSGLQDAEVLAVRSPSAGFLDDWIQCAEQFLSIHQPKLVLHFGTKRGLSVWPNAINLNLR